MNKHYFYSFCQNHRKKKRILERIETVVTFTCVKINEVNIAKFGNMMKKIIHESSQAFFFCRIAIPCYNEPPNYTEAISVTIYVKCMKIFIIKFYTFCILH